MPFHAFLSCGLGEIDLDDCGILSCCTNAHSLRPAPKHFWAGKRDATVVNLHGCRGLGRGKDHALRQSQVLPPDRPSSMAGQDPPGCNIVAVDRPQALQCNLCCEIHELLGAVGLQAR